MHQRCVTPVIELDGVSKRFGAVTALDEVSAAVRSGRITGLIGANGSGKTTMLRLLADLARPTSGNVRVFGHPPSFAQQRARIGIAFASMPVPGRLSGAEVLAHIARLRRRSDLGVGDALARRLDLDLRRRADQLSRGNRQKLALVQALMHEPELVLLDEPTTGLDPVAQVAVQEVLREIVEAGATVLLSSHVLAEVRSTATHVLALNGGRVVVDGSMASILSSIPRRVSAEITGSRPELERVLGGSHVRELHRGDDYVRWNITGRLAADPNELIASLADLDVRELHIAEAQLDDLVEELYR